MKKNKNQIKFPRRVLQPIKLFLQKKESKLNRRKKELEKEDPYNNVDRLNDNAAADTDAAEEFGHDRVAAMKKEIDRALIRIRKSLSKIKLGKYGICEHCGKMIDTDRLSIDPTASLCMKCQREKKDK